jgi:aryl-alcohol dehydrogenase-like predicted oxidoreductase
MNQESAAGARAIGPVRVSPIGLGCASLSIDHGDDQNRGQDAVAAALDAGVTLLDTALAYTTMTEPNHNERLIRRVLAQAPDREVLVATKGGHFRAGAAFPIDARPATLRRHCELSLRALGVEQLGLYQLHWPDPAVPIAESVGTLAQLQQEGKIARLGVSNVDLAQLAEAKRVATIVSVQNKFSLFHQAGRDVLDYCTEAGIAFLAYSPLRGLPSAEPAVAEQLAALAEVHVASPARVALAWLLAQSPRLIPIAGATRRSTVVDAASAGGLTLGAGELASLDAAGTRLGA